MADPVSLSEATAIQLEGGIWYELQPQSLGVAIDPSFVDPVTGAVVTPGDPFVQFIDGAGQAYAAPFRAVTAVKLAAPVT